MIAVCCQVEEVSPQQSFEAVLRKHESSLDVFLVTYGFDGKRRLRLGEVDGETLEPMYGTPRWRDRFGGSSRDATPRCVQCCALCVGQRQT